jgi:hypothetical protein
MLNRHYVGLKRFELICATLLDPCAVIKKFTSATTPITKQPEPCRARVDRHEHTHQRPDSFSSSAKSVLKQN